MTVSRIAGIEGPGMRAVLHLYRAAFAGLPREIWLLSLTALVNRAGTMVLPFMSLYFIQDRGLSVLEAGRLIGLYGIGSVAGSYLGGWLSDRLGALRVQVLSLVGTGAGFLWLASLADVTWIAVALFLVSVVGEAFRPAVMASAAEFSPPEAQARCFGLLRLAVNLGMAVGPAAGGFLATVGYHWLFVADAGTCLLAAILLVVLFDLGAPGPDHESPAVPEATRSPWRDGPFLALLVLVFLLATTFFQVFSTLPVHLRQSYALPENLIGLLLGFNALLIVVFEMPLLHWGERRDRLVVAGAGCFLVCAGLGLLPLGASLGFAALTVVVWTVGEMLALPLLNAIVAGRAGPRQRGRYMGAYLTAYSLAFIAAPVVGTYVFERFGPATLWYGVGVLGPLLWLGALALARSFRTTPGAPARVPGVAHSAGHRPSSRGS